MNIQITARKFKAHETLKEFIKDELTSLKRFNDDIINADVKLSFQNTQNSIKIAEVILSIPGQKLTAKEESDDFKKSVAGAVEKLRNQLTTIKSKRTSKTR
ncbi:ribosome-associated translation inhibitor RaiA [Ignavibacterium sp.]|uniref:ribosome hibernation-promoting factor, HPF/YfiA family n=1 Tax=Ignavibacterium sp. TaxID=2651167 RepID=UPI00307E7AD5